MMVCTKYGGMISSSPHVDNLLGARNAIKLWEDMIAALATKVIFFKVGRLTCHLCC